MSVSTNIGTADPFVGQILADKYRVEEILREDDFGTVYMGTHLLMEKPVTIKVLSPALAIDSTIVDRFSLEAKTISRISHSNILNITDFGRDVTGAVFIVMEYVEGETVEEILRRDGAFEPERAARIARNIAAALSAAHASKVFHTALSSSKVLVSPVGNGQDIVKVFDIGSFSTGFESKSVSDMSLEEVAYLSPEQCIEESAPDERSDIYSLGILLYEMLTGEVPFMANTVHELIAKHADVPPPPLVAFKSDIPSEIEPVLLNALAKNPDRRYQSAAALAEDLAEVFKSDGEDETIVIPKVADEKAAVNNNIWKTAFIVLAGISVIGFGLIYWTNAKSTDPQSALPTDANSQPVQPLNPATGLNEQGNLMTLPPGMDPSLDPSLGDGGGDGYDPWGNVPVPPSGGSRVPQNFPAGGDTWEIPVDPNNPFTTTGPGGDTVILVPKYVTPTPDPKASPSPSASPGKVTPSPEATQKPAATPAATPKPPTPDPKKSEPKKPAATPAPPTAPPASANKSIKSGVEQDT
ncbi:MAG: serine/threonine-protein kinase [Pyrinomonadaceae bacterium]